MTEQPNDTMTAGDVAEYLGISVKTLYNWRSEGRAPLAHRINGGHPRYYRSEVDAFIRQTDILEKPRKLRRGR